MAIIILIVFVIWGVKAFNKWINDEKKIKEQIPFQIKRCRGITLSIKDAMRKERDYKNKIKLKELSIISCGDKVFDSIDKWVCYNDSASEFDSLTANLDYIASYAETTTSFSNIKKASFDLNNIETSLKQISSMMTTRLRYLKNKVDETEFLLQAARIQKKENELLYISSGENNKKSGTSYEFYCAEWLEANGYENVEVTKQSGDFGADIICYKYGEKIAVQCKKWANPVGAVEIQKLIGAQKFYDADKSLFITTSNYTPQAVQMAMKCNVELKTVKMQGDY